MNEITAVSKEQRRLNDFAAALDAEKITIIITDKNGTTQEREVNANEIEKEAAGLSKSRDEGCLITMKPASEDRQYIIVSGITEASYIAMKEDGYAPAAMIETGENKYQALFKINNAPEGKIEKLQEVLCNRYGDGTKEQSIAVPGHYYNSHETFPRVAVSNAAAQDMGAARMLERLNEQAPKYQEQEALTAKKASMLEVDKSQKVETVKSIVKDFLQAKEIKTDNKKENITGRQNVVDNEMEKIHGNKEGIKEKEKPQEQEQQKNYGLFDLLADFIRMVMRLVALATKTLYNEVQAKRGGEQIEMPASLWEKGRANDERVIARSKEYLQPTKEQGQEQGKKKETFKETVLAATKAMEQEKQDKASAAAIKHGRNTMENAKKELDQGLSR